MASIQEDLQNFGDEMQTEMQERGERLFSDSTEFIRSVPFAALGATLKSVERTRNAVKAGFEFPSRMIERTRKAPSQLRESYTERAERGRLAYNRILNRESVENAANQVRYASHKAKGATTSAGTAVRKASAAIEDAAEAAFDPQDTRAYEDRTVAELRELASDREISGRSGLNKKQLIKALRNAR